MYLDEAVAKGQGRAGVEVDRVEIASTISGETKRKAIEFIEFSEKFLRHQLLSISSAPKTNCHPKGR